MPPMGKRRGLWIFIGILIFLLVAGLWIAAFALAGGGFLGRPTTLQQWEEQLLEDADTSDKVAMVSVSGEIFSDPEGLTLGASDENITSQLDQALDDPDVAAVILELDTPGGGVVPSDLIYRKVLKVREQIPVVALMEDVAASGGYYVASGANRIVANPASLTGSIGVIMFLPNLEGTAEKLGVRPLVLKSGPHKDIGSPFREMTGEEIAILQEIIDEAYDQFVNAVVEGRGMEESKVRELGDGRIYTGRQALDLGLVDSIGDRDDAFAAAIQLADLPEARLVRYTRTLGITEALLNLEANLDVTRALEDLFAAENRPGLSYLWLP